MVSHIWPPELTPVETSEIRRPECDSEICKVARFLRDYSVTKTLAVVVR